MLAVAGGVLGMAGAVAYGWLVLTALGTWWRGAVGTSALHLHVSGTPLAIGLAGGVAMALIVVALTLRSLRHATPRLLLSGSRQRETAPGRPPVGARRIRLAAALLIVAILVVASATAGWLSATIAFFGAGGLLLVAALIAFAASLRGRHGSVIVPTGAWSLARLGFRATTDHPGRAVLSAALIASATFTILAVGAFRRDVANPRDRTSGTGGYTLIAETAVPIVHDPSSAPGREELGLLSADEAWDRVTFARFRLRPGDDASCLNLYRPQHPRIVAPTEAFRAEARFSFGATLAATDEERANPWRLLDRRFPDGAIPAIADATSLTYVFHLAVGDDLVIERPGAPPVTLRMVGALRDSIFQSELLIAERDFVGLFPRLDGYRFLLADTGALDAHAAAAALERAMADYGLDAEATTARLEAFHRVENTYLSTFQALGGLGLVLGTVGVAAVLVRNVLERRRELALLGAIGYRGGHLTAIVMAETALLVVGGVVIGATCALIAVAPAIWSRGSPVPAGLLVGLLAAIACTALLASAAAAVVARRLPMLETLRGE